MKKLIIAIVLSVTIPVMAQMMDENYLESQKIFDDQSVGTVEIQIKPEYLNYLMNHVDSDTIFPASFIFANDKIQGDTVKNVGFRLRGTTSRNANKKSFKIDFNEFVKGQKFHALEKMNLKAVFTDPSVIRAKLYSDIARTFGIPCFRANHVKVYINNEYRGLYINVEHIDENFLQTRFKNNDGNLYKCAYGADLTCLGSDQTAYEKLINQYGKYVYELKTNKDLNDFSDLIHLIDVINNTSEDSFKIEIENVFNVPGFLKCLAVDVLTGNWDNYWYLGNNFYLYHNPATDKFEWIPYDADETFGLWWDSKNFAKCNIYTWGKDWKYPLTRNIMQVEAYRNIYSRFISDLAHNVCKLANLEFSIDSIHVLITPALETDLYYGTNYQYSIEDFHNSYHASLPAFSHVQYGLKPFISTRTSYALKQLDFYDMSPLILETSHHPLMPGSQDSITITALIIDDGTVTNATVRYDTGSGDQEIDLVDDGYHGDGRAGDHVFGAVIPSQSAGTSIYYYIQVRDNAGNEKSKPENAPSERFSFRIELETSTPAIYINEFLTSNDSLNTDEFGEFDDWIEIYNSEDTAVSLNGMYLTNDLSNPTKWNLPDTMLESKEFLLIWADHQPEQGKLHANFKVNKNGGQIGLFDTDANHNTPIDTLTFGAQTTDVAYGRIVDGSNIWISFTMPTPGISNATHWDTTTLQIRHIAVDNITSNSVKILWETNTPSNSRVVYGLTRDNLQQTIDDCQMVMQHEIRLTELLPDTTYYFRVHSYDLHDIDQWGDEHCFSTMKNDEKLNIILQIEVMPYRSTGTYEAPGWYFGDNGIVEQSLYFNREGIYKFTLRVKGEAAGGIWPEFQLSIDDTNLATKTVNVAEFDTLSITAIVDSGRHAIKIAFTNYFSDSIETRKLIVDWLKIEYTHHTAGFKHKGLGGSSANELVLHQNYPNPANPLTRIQYQIPRSARITLKIFNLFGQEVRVLVNSFREVGSHSIIWDGQDDHGQPVSSAVYLCQLEADGIVQTKKIIILK